MMDIVFPNNNEHNFIEIASKLGYTSLCFVYCLKDFQNKLLEPSINLKYGVICSEKDIAKAKKLTDLIFVKSSENPRHLVESNKNITIFDFEQNPKKDMFTQRRSGLNHILCDLAVKNNITIGFSFNSLLKADIKQRNVLLGRMSANLDLCKKYKNKVIFASFTEDPYEMRSYKDLKTFF